MENKSNQSGTQNRNRSNNRNRSRNRSGQNRNQSSNQGNSRNRNHNRNRNRSRNRKPKKIELSMGQKIIKAITFGAIDPNKKPKKKANRPKASSNSKPATTNAAAKPKKARSQKIHEVTSPRLFVGNLDYEATESDLEDLFRGVGNVSSAEVVTNSRTQQSKGFAFVEMGSLEEAKRAVDILHDQDFMGRKLLVSGAKSDGPRNNEDSSSDDRTAEAA